MTDFTAGEATDDRLDFSDFGFADLSAVQAASDDGSGTTDVKIQLDADDSVTLTGVQIADLYADEFIFA